jgi:hypothetical protein
MSHNSFFTNVYESNMWGNNSNKYYKGSSGGGSTLEFNENFYIPFLKEFIVNKNIKSVVDLGCGDFECGPLIYGDLVDIKYTGYDVYEKVIDYHTNHNVKTMNNSKYEFKHLNIYEEKDKLISADLCILKDILQHWYVEEIYDFLDYLISTKKYKYILLCNSCNQKYDYVHETSRSIPLSIHFLPLKKYNLTLLSYYNDKEISLLTLN